MTFEHKEEEVITNRSERNSRTQAPNTSWLNHEHSPSTRTQPEHSNTLEHNDPGALCSRTQPRGGTLEKPEHSSNTVFSKTVFSNTRTLEHRVPKSTKFPRLSPRDEGIMATPGRKRSRSAGLLGMVPPIGYANGRESGLFRPGVGGTIRQSEAKQGFPPGRARARPPARAARPRAAARPGGPRLSIKTAANRAFFFDRRRGGRTTGKRQTSLCPRIPAPIR